MDGVADFLNLFAGAPSGVIGGLPPGGFLLITALALFGAYLVNGLSQRHSFLHMLISIFAMLVGALAGNALLSGWRIPLAHELLVSAVLALVGMTVAGLALIVAYRRVDI